MAITLSREMNFWVIGAPSLVATVIGLYDVDLLAYSTPYASLAAETDARITYSLAVHSQGRERRQLRRSSLTVYR